jgi:hypothetical protein
LFLAIFNIIYARPTSSISQIREKNKVSWSEIGIYWQIVVLGEPFSALAITGLTPVLVIMSQGVKSKVS